MTLAIVADDLAGACDTGSLFARTAPVPVTIWPRVAGATAVAVVDTESRSLDARDAVARIRDTAGRTGATRHFKKIDSTLRGCVAAETEALMAATGAASALLCPAFPAQGRIVVDRVLSVNGAPVTETPIARDPTFPGRRALAPRRTADVVELLRSDFARPLAWVPLREVRAGAPALAARLGRLTDTVAIADAATDADLDLLVEAALAAEPPPLLVGAAGLARALAVRLGLLAKRAALPAGRRWLVVAGSRHPMTRRQVAAARAAGITVIAGPDADDEPDAVASRIAEDARRALEADDYDLVAVTGGATAAALFRALEAERLDLVGAPRPGLAFGYLQTPRRPCLPLLTKAGGFGDADLFPSLLEESAR